jgi:phosphoserine phosphatase
MRALLSALEAAGIEVWLASASHAALVEAGAPHLGVPVARVRGMEPTAGLSDPPRMQSRTYGDDKRDTATRVLGARPLAAFGDSVLFTDRALLESAHLPFAVATRGPHRDAALAHPRMLLVDP